MFTVKVITETDYKYTFSEMRKVLENQVLKTGIKNSEIHYENCKKLFCEFLKNNRKYLLGNNKPYKVICNGYGELVCIRIITNFGDEADISITGILNLIEEAPDRLLNKTLNITIDNNDD